MEKQTAIPIIDKIMLSHGMKRVDWQGSDNDSLRHMQDRSYVDFRKSSLYLVHVMSGADEATLQSRRSFFRKLAEQKQISADRIFILYLILTEAGEEDRQKAFPLPDMEDNIIEIYWLLDTQAEQLIFPPDQPTSFMKLEKELAQMQSDKQVKVYSLENNTKISYVSYGLILINGLVWILEERMGGSQRLDVLLNMGAMNGMLVQGGEWFRLLTAMFLHIGLGHLVMNSAGILIFGSRLEKRISSPEVAIIYFVGGIVGNIFSFVYHSGFGDANVVAAGASGAVYALMGALLCITYFSRRRAGGLDAYAIFLYFLVGMIVSVIQIQIDFAAHLGGFVAGFLTAVFVLQRRKKYI